MIPFRSGSNFFGSLSTSGLGCAGPRTGSRGPRFGDRAALPGGCDLDLLEGVASQQDEGQVVLVHHLNHGRVRVRAEQTACSSTMLFKMSGLSFSVKRRMVHVNVHLLVRDGRPSHVCAVLVLHVQAVASASVLNNLAEDCASCAPGWGVGDEHAH